MVKPGYKQTEIGLIPEKWECFLLGERVKIFRGGSPRPIEAYITSSADGVNWIKIGDVKEGDKYITSTQEKILQSGASKSRAVHVGDFILSNSMSFGRPYILAVDGCIHDGWLTIQNYDNCFIKEFLYYLLSSEKIYNQYIAMAAGSSVKNLNKEKVSSVVVVCPANTEQQLIANALSDIDELIFSLEKLIAKKKAVKQGAMQDLLTGKKRLPGFSGEWEMLRLEQILDYEQPINYIVGNEDYTYSGTPVLTAGKSFVLGYTNEDFGIFTDLPIILFDDFLTASRYVDFKFKVKSSAVKMLKKRRSQDNIRVIFEMMQLIDFQVVDHQRHWISQFSKLTIKLPNADEQNAIADTIANMDNEIESLEKKLAKYRNIKQGMMQQLLTGQIRLV